MSYKKVNFSSDICQRKSWHSEAAEAFGMVFPGSVILLCMPSEVEIKISALNQ